MSSAESIAGRLRAGDSSAVQAIGCGVIRLQHTNLVERPWGGLRMLPYKGCIELPDQKKITGMGIGEAFETAAFDDDPESAAFPSTACFADGSVMELPQLLRCAGRAILGEALQARFGAAIPLLPKTLDIEELLSVQAHPAGNTELYVILDAQPGASIRLGFRQSVDKLQLQNRLTAGRAVQLEFLGLLQPDLDQHQLHTALAPLLASRDRNHVQLNRALQQWLLSDTDHHQLHKLFDTLHDTYWYMLDLMNEIKVHPGQVIYNATPERVLARRGGIASAEIHALGNPDQREILMLEIRRPGVTYRAWDNVRFPLREIDIDKTLQELHLGQTRAEEFIVQPQANPDQPAIRQLVANEHFTVDQVELRAGDSVEIAQRRFATLHFIAGHAEINTAQGRLELQAGQSAIVPAALSEASLQSNGGVTLVRVFLD